MDFLLNQYHKDIPSVPMRGKARLGFTSAILSARKDSMGREMGEGRETNKCDKKRAHSVAAHGTGDSSHEVCGAEWLEAGPSR
jgi:hypothetical protein